MASSFARFRLPDVGLDGGVGRDGGVGGVICGAGLRADLDQDLGRWWGCGFGPHARGSLRPDQRRNAVGGVMQAQFPAGAGTAVRPAPLPPVPPFEPPTPAPLMVTTKFCFRRRIITRFRRVTHSGNLRPAKELQLPHEHILSR
ncbi:hypothetical protein, partial [Paractinoplanes toevensis]|uniref:hypothetical protein n=1 Tax=Paractinoplanes toevensis TaxID=571911 RepID=UPI001BB3B4E0